MSHDSRPERENARIQYLLDCVNDSKATFIRNEEEYSSYEARKHLERKLDVIGGKIQTAEQFVEQIAAKSSLSGQPYIIRFPDGKTEKAASWLFARLREYQETATR